MIGGTTAAATIGWSSNSVASTTAAKATSGATAIVISRCRGVLSCTLATMNSAIAKPRMRSPIGSVTTRLSSMTAKNASTPAKVARAAASRRSAPGSGGNSRS